MLITIADDNNTMTLDTTKLGARGKELEVLFEADCTLTVDEAHDLGLGDLIPATVATTEEAKEETMTKKETVTPTIRVEYMGRVIAISETRLVELGMNKRSNLALLGKELTYEEFAAKANKDLGVLVIARFREVLSAKRATPAVKRSPLVASAQNPKDIEQNNSAVQWLLGTIDFESKVDEEVLNNMRVWRNPGNQQVAYISFDKRFYMQNRQLCQNLYRDIGEATNKLEAGQWEAKMTYGVCKFR